MQRESVRAGDGNRTRTISLGIGQIAADQAAEQPTSETVSSLECPLMTQSSAEARGPPVGAEAA
jgi:hypothetical protein